LKVVRWFALRTTLKNICFKEYSVGRKKKRIKSVQSFFE